MTGEDLTVGSVGLSVLLMIVLRLIYGTFPVSEKLKPWIAVLLGIGLAMLALWSSLKPEVCIHRSMWIDYMIRGFMTGASAIGLHEMVKGMGRKDGNGS